MSSGNTALAQQLNKAWRFFYRRGFIDGFGHISARTEAGDQVLVSPHSLGAESRPEDFVLCDLDGRALQGGGPLPGELPIHLEIYKRRPDAGSVAHFHVLHATSFSMSELPLKASYFLAAIFRAGIPIHPDPRFVTNARWPVSSRQASAWIATSTRRRWAARGRSADELRQREPRGTA